MDGVDGIGIGLVDGVLEAVRVELLIDELATAVAVHAVKERVR